MYSGYYDEKIQGKATAYLPAKDNDTLKLPEKFHISYTGAFPVYSDTLNSLDFKGLIAFNGKTLKNKPLLATEYTDVTTQKQFQDEYCPKAAKLGFSLILKQRGLDQWIYNCQ